MRKNSLNYYLILLVLLLPLNNFSQTLSAGDIAFIGFHFDDADGFTFITLKDIPGGEIIYFTDHSWDYTNNTWHNNEADAHYSWTAPVSGVAIGTIIDVSETSADVLTPSIGIMNKETIGSFSVVQSGDAVFAYQSTAGAKPTAANATFLAGIYTDDNYAHNTDCDGAQGWYNGVPCASDSTPDGEPISNGANASGIPPGLTNGVNAIHFFPSPILETVTGNDNGRYSGSLTGDATTIRTAINNKNNWEFGDDPSFNTSTSYFASPNITPTLSLGDLKEANDYYIYPNPSQNKMIKVKSNFEGSIDIINQVGQVLQTIRVNGNIEQEYNVFNLPSGIYYLKPQNKLITKSHKLIVK